MPLRITKEKTKKELKRIVEDSSGVTIDLCLQCKRCASGCPVSVHAESSPSEIIKHLQMGAGEELLENEFIWMCAGCGTCLSRCPMKIDSSALMDSLKVLAEKMKAEKPKGNMPLMNRILLGTMKYFGRTYDMGAMVLYKIGTSTYMKDTDKVPAILRKGKIALLPPRGADRRTVKRIFAMTGADKDKRK
jgi:heterodisulfide reductase subunit C2